VRAGFERADRADAGPPRSTDGRTSRPDVPPGSLDRASRRTAGRGTCKRIERTDRTIVASRKIAESAPFLPCARAAGTSETMLRGGK